MMRSMCVLLALTVILSCGAEPLRVVLLDFEDQTGMRPDEQLGGGIQPGALAQKGVYLLSKQLLGSEDFVLIDRRDFLAQVEQLRPRDSGERTPTKPSFLQAAQALNADAVLRGSLVSFSSGKQVVNQGGYETSFTTLKLRVAVEALDAVDGTIIAMADGVAAEKFRQTESLQTILSEDDILDAFGEALGEVVPDLEEGLMARMEARADRPKVKLSIKTSDDPALIEIDGVLVGTSPVDGLEVYKGDHVLTIGKPGYQDITKRIMFEKNSSIEVPMIRVKLTAEEMKEVMEKMRMHVVVGEPALVIHTMDDE